MKEKILNIFKNIKEKNKNMIFILTGIIVLVPLSFWLLSTDDKNLSESFEKSMQTDNNQTQEYNPPKLENPFEQKQKTQENNQTKEQINNTSKDDFTSFVKDIKKQEINSNENLSQEEAIRQIAKTQKPKDMIVFLKDIQKDIEFEGSKNTFKYDLKSYKAGDKFLEWFEIEIITKNLIRFKDKDYAYNLRFLGE